MKKYMIAASIAFGEYFVYRLNFILWRVRNVLSVLMVYFLWHAVYLQRNDIFSYGKDEMLTYVLMITFTGAAVVSTRAYKIAEDINTGNLKTYLLQPVSYIGLTAAREITDKILNVGFSLVEFGILLILLRPPFLYPASFGTFILFFAALFLAVLLYFAFGVILSCLGFWSREIWAPRFLFYIIVTFLSGMYFPLDIVEGSIGRILTFLPFGYLVYFPIAIFQQRLASAAIVTGFFIAIMWIIILSFIAKRMWRNGLRTFTAEGS